MTEIIYTVSNLHMQRENHKENFKRTCRIYASIIVLKDGYINAKNVPDYSDPLYTKLILEIIMKIFIQDLFVVDEGENWTGQLKEMY